MQVAWWQGMWGERRKHMNSQKSCSVMMLCEPLWEAGGEDNVFHGMDPSTTQTCQHKTLDSWEKS